MLVVVLEERNPLAMAELAVDQARLAEGGPGALDVEVVLGAAADERGPRGAHREVVGVLHAERHLAGDVLLGVLRADGGEQPL